LVLFVFGGQIVQAGGVANDTCATAPALLLDTPALGTNAGAIDDYRLFGAGCFAGAGQLPSSATGGDAAYRFVAPATGDYSIRVHDYATSSNLVLYASTTCPAGPAPATVTSCIGAGNRRVAGPAEEVFCLPLLQDDTIWVYVDEASPAGGSSFTIEVSECRREVEPNDVPEEEVLEGQGAGLTCNDEGSIDPPGDLDYWALGALIADARVFSLIDGVATDLTDFDLRVTTDLDTLEYDDLNNDVEYGVNSPNVGGTPLDGAEAFLRVTYNDPFVASEPYRLYTTVQPPLASATVESEPNDAASTADSATHAYFYGNLPGPPPSADADVYAFQASAGDLVHVGLDGDPLRNVTPINPKLELLGPNGTTVLREINDGSASSSSCVGCIGVLDAETPFAPAEGLVYRIPADGTYYVRVKIGNVSPFSDGAGDYLLSIAVNCEPTLDPAADHDGDGVITAEDCAPLIPGTFHAPLEIENVRFADKDTVEWDSAVPSAGTDTVHDLMRGVIADLPVSGAESEVCLLPDSPPTFFVDTESPLPGEGFYYIVRGHNECGDGTYGFASDGSERTPEGPNGCP
jgi:hypothetical protein